MIVRVCVAILVCLGLCVLAPRANAEETLLAGRVLMPDGSLQQNCVVAMEDGVVQRVGKASELDAKKVQRHAGDVVISPGLIDLFAAPGSFGQTVEDTEAIEPEASPLDVLDPTHHDFRIALESGITAVMASPAATNLVSGNCVTVRTHTSSQLDVLRNDGPLLLAFGEGVWRSDRIPTSRAGAVHALRQLIDRARHEAAPARINAAVAGKLDAWFVCTEKQDVLTVRQLLGDSFSQFGLVHSQDALQLVDILKAGHQPVVVGPYTMSTSKRELLGAAALADAGVEVALRGGFPAPNKNVRALQLTAALAVRYGMDADAARRAITIAPAKVAGVDKRIGSIAEGKDADLVIFSQDPLRMDARVLEVYVRGQRVYSARHQNLTLGGVQP